MSAILLSNPFVTPTPPAIGAAPPGNALTPQAIAPVAAGGASQGAGDAASKSGGNAFRGDDSGQIAQYLAKREAASAAPARPSDATPDSVVSAQASDRAVLPDILGNNLPEVEMPDPLPTSPFLAALRKSD